MQAAKLNHDDDGDDDDGDDDVDVDVDDGAKRFNNPFNMSEHQQVLLLQHVPGMAVCQMRVRRYVSATSL